MPQDRSTAAEPAIIRTRLQRLQNLVGIQADPDWARLYVKELLGQEPDSPDAHCPRFAGLVEESGDRTLVVAETIEALADEMAGLVTNEIPMSAIEMIDLDTQERRQAHTKAEVGFLPASQPDIPVAGTERTPARAHTFTVGGPTVEAVTVEVDVRPGLPAFSIIALSDAAVRETRERVQAAILNCGYEFPARRITANIAAPRVRRLGPCIDLALACALLAASGQIPSGALASHAVYGRLALDGRIQPCPDPLAIARLTRERGLTALVLAAEERPATALVEHVTILAAADLRAAVRALTAAELTGPFPAEF